MNSPALSLIRIGDVQRRTGLSRSAIYALAKRREFPAPVKITPNGIASAWIESEVDNYLAKRIAASRQQSDAA